MTGMASISGELRKDESIKAPTSEPPARGPGEPQPALKMRGPGRIMHWGKVAFEQYWLRRWF